MKNAKALKLSALGSIVVIASTVLIFGLADFSALAEPSWAERQMATNVLSFKIHLSRPERTAPGPFDASSLQHGLELFQRSCAFCHGSPDGKPAAFADTLSPRPPQFFRDARPIPIWQAAYIIRRGVRWTGMPAFPNISDRDAWLIALMLESKTKRLLVLNIEGIAQGENPRGADPLSGFRPYLIVISVPDVQQAAAWYEQKLGFKRGSSEKTDAGMALIVEETPGIAVELLQFDGSFSVRRSNPGYDTASGKLQGIVNIGFAVDNLEAALADLKRKQVRVLREITELKSFNVKFFLIEDNNGNVIQLFQARKNQTQTEGAVNP